MGYLIFLWVWRRWLIRASDFLAVICAVRGSPKWGQGLYEIWHVIPTKLRLGYDVKRYSDEQIMAVLKQHKLGDSVVDVCLKLGIAEATFYRWKKDYAGLEPDQIRKLKQLREENSQPKKLVADLTLNDVNSRSAKRIVTTLCSAPSAHGVYYQ